MSDPFNTQPGLPQGGSDAPPALTRFKVKEFPYGSLTNVARCRLINDAGAEGHTDFLVVIPGGASVGSEIYAARPSGGTGNTDAGSRPIPWRQVGGGSLQRVRIVSDGGYGPGRYAGKMLLAPTVDIPTTGAITVSMIGGDGADCVVVNLQEMNLGSSHWLTMPENEGQKVFLGELLPVKCGGKPCVAIGGIWVGQKTVQTDYRVVPEEFKFQKRNVAGWLPMAAATSDWIDVHTGEECPEEVSP